jgi:methyl-accepting chemotaxis protein
MVTDSSDTAEITKAESLVKEITYLNTGVAYIVDKAGKTLYHPQANYIEQSVNAFVPGLNFRQMGVQSFNVAQEDYLFVISEIPGRNWYLIGQIAKSNAFRAIDVATRNSWISGGIALVVVSIVLIFAIFKLLAPVRQLETAIHDVAHGDADLTQRINTNIDPEFAPISTDFNLFLDKLQTQISKTQKLSEQVLQSTESNLSYSDSTLTTAESQSKEIEQIAAAMNEMSVASHEVAQNAQNATVVVQTASDSTKSSAAIVTEAAETISKLNTQLDNSSTLVRELTEASNSIESVLTVITGISEQTNLLALNAAIEAARAGESGRGFAVVADEVRTLAQRTQDSTTEIRSMINSLQQGTQSMQESMTTSMDMAQVTVVHASRASTALDEISGNMDKINDINVQIATAAEQQSLVAEEINNNTVRVQDLSVEVADAAKNSAAAIQNQMSLIHQQEQELKQFIV